MRLPRITKNSVVYLLAGLQLLAALGLRLRVAKVPVLSDIEDGERPEDDEYVFLTLPGLMVDGATRRAALAFARDGKYDVLDIWPAGLPLSDARAVANSADPSTYAKRRFASGNTAGQLLVVRREIAERSRIEPPSDPIAFQKIARRLKRYSRVFGVAIAPTLIGRPRDSRWRLALLNSQFGLATPLACVLAMFAGMMPLLGLKLWGKKAATLVLASQLAPAVATGGTALAPAGVISETLLHIPADMWRWAIGIIAQKRAPAAIEEGERATYASLLANGVGPFFEEPAKTCALCGSDGLEPYLRSPDNALQKPGEFSLVRCTSCEFIFQNPRLSLEGLSFYYRDSYDGESTEFNEMIYESESYGLRANMLTGLCVPERWLDVGTGYGYFCEAAKEYWPHTRFDGLDQGDQLDEAERRGWVDRGYHGQFIDYADDLRGRYDVVSMSHYLEHTREPKAELQTALAVLKPGGFLLIEQPNPKCGLAEVLGRWWIGWAQPQHQHFIDQANFEKLFRENGFSVVKWYWPPSYADLSVAFFFMLCRLGPPDRPWLPKRSLPWRIFRSLVWTLGPVVFLPTLAFDYTVGRIIDRKPYSSTFGVVARKM